MIYEARATLVRGYVGQELANPLKYAAGILDLPLPAVYFYPSEATKREGYVNGIVVENIDEHREDLHIIRAHRRETEGFVVIAGIVAFAETRPCVDFDLVDLSALLWYCHERLFGRRGARYPPEIDDMYDRDFQRLIRAGSPPS